MQPEPPSSIGNFAAQAITAFRSGNACPGISTGLSDLDQKIGGLQRGKIMILAGRPSMGATRLAVSIAFNAAAAKHCRVAFISNQHSREAISQRVLAAQTGIDLFRIIDGDLTESEIEKLASAALNLLEIPLIIDEAVDQPIEWLVARIRDLHQRRRLDLVVIDALQMIRRSGDLTKDGLPDYSHITGHLKALARDLGIPVIVTSNVSRTAELNDGSVPRLSDLAEYGAIEYDANIVAFLHRDEYVVEREEPDSNEFDDDQEFRLRHSEWRDRLSEVAGIAKILVARNVHGPVGTVFVEFDSGSGKFGDLTESA